jgi:hypothetical protein
MEYSDFQNQPSSEKIVLATLGASKRLMGWSLHSGSIYKIENFSFSVIESIEDSGTAYVQVSDIGSVTAGKYFLDRDAQTVYLRTTGSDNPNSRFLVATLTLFFSNVPIVLPFDLDEGFDVFWEPLIRSNSEFGVEIDTIAQASEAIEGSGSLTLENDQDFWPKYFDKLSFENQRAVLYSYNRGLELSQARRIFKGRVEKKSYARDSVNISLKDQFAELRTAIPLANMASLSARTGDDLAEAKQRMILGRVFGIVPTNIDRVLDGYPITGTVSISFDSTTLTGSGTQFLAEISPDDRLVIDEREYTVASVASNTSLELTEGYEGNAVISGTAITLLPDQPKRFINREFKVAGHALRQPVTTIEAGSTTSFLNVADTTDIYPSDTIYVDGELAVVDSVVGQYYLRLATSLAVVPAVGTQVIRPAVQNVRINNVRLSYERDYTFDAETAQLTLNPDAEANASPVFQLTDDITFTNTSRSVTGVGFNGKIKPGFMLGMVGHSQFFEVLSVDSDTEITLRTPATFTDTDNGLYRSLIYDESDSVLSLDALGRTEDGTTSGRLLVTAPSITKALLEDMGLDDEIEESSFETAEAIGSQHVGIIVPATYQDTATPLYRDVLNKINKSILGALVQNEDFKFSYQVLRPKKTLNAVKFTESDILSFSLLSTAENVVKTCMVEYKPKEYDYVVNNSSVLTESKVSSNATYITKTARQKTISTLLVDQRDAIIMAARWSFLLSRATGRLTFTTKLQGATLQVGDIIEVEHRKFFERFGSTAKRKLLLVEAVGRSGSAVKIEATDLSNVFNRVACITDNTADYSSASEDERLYGGYITDQYGLIDNNPESFETNLIW